MSSKIVSYRRATILSGRDFGLSQTVDIVRFNLSEILYKIYSRQTNRVWGNILSSETSCSSFIYYKREREREVRRRRPSAAGGAEEAEAMALMAQRSSGRRGAGPAATVVDMGSGNPPALHRHCGGSGRRSGVERTLAELPVGLAQTLDR